MDDELKKTEDRKKIIILCCIAFVLVIVALSFLINNLLKGNEGVQISNAQNISGVIDNKDYSLVKKELVTMLKANYKIDNSDVKTSIRESSYKETDTGNKKTITFLMDVETVKATYNVWLIHDTSNDGAAGVTFTCADLDVTKYPDTFCIGTEFYSTIDVQLGKKLPHSGYIDGKYAYEISHEAYDPHLKVGITTLCGDQTAYDKAYAAAMDWIDQQGIDHSIYPITMVKDACTPAAEMNIK